MGLARALAELESRPGGVGLPDLETTKAADRLRQFIEPNGGLPIERDCRQEILAIDLDDLTETIIPAFLWLRNLAESEGRRVVVGLCGPAAAGKSTLAQLLCAASNILWGPSKMTTLSMDAYSFPNSYLSTEQAEDHAGRPCTLKDIKGHPKTLDSASLLRDLDRLRAPNAETILLPAYSRSLHDPVPDRVVVSPECQVILLEGLHLLHQEGHWKDIFTALHRTVFLDIERSCCFDRVVGRKVANGRSRESSEAHFDRVDGPVWDQLQHEKSRASLTLTVRPTNGRHLNISYVIVQRIAGDEQEVDVGDCGRK